MGGNNLTNEIFVRYHELWYSISGFPILLEGHGDANWILDLDEIKSTSGYIFILGGGVVSWKSSKQSLIA